MRGLLTLIMPIVCHLAEEDLSEMFGRVGGLARLVLPPTRTLALIEYLEPQDARAAFRSLAYKKFNYVPLYLEWAPKDIFTPEAPRLDAPGPKPAKDKATKDKPAAGAKDKAGGREDKAAAAAVLAPAEGDEDGSTPTIFVKNLAFATSDASLRRHFDKAVSSVGGTLANVKVARRKAADGKLLSMGYGFVECDSEATAKLVVKKLQVGLPSAGARRIGMGPGLGLGLSLHIFSGYIFLVFMLCQITYYICFNCAFLLQQSLLQRLDSRCLYCICLLAGHCHLQLRHNQLSSIAGRRALR